MPNTNIYRKDFPILKTRVHGHPLVYLDNGATTQKPKRVLDAMFDFYTNYNANIHRGIHDLSQRATDAVEHARASIAKLIGADASEVIFTYGTTAGINHIAYGWAEQHLKSGDEILLSMMEHHANTVPWLELKKRKPIKLSFVPLTKTFELDYAAMEKMVTKKTKLISLVHVSNVLGTENSIARIVKIAKRVGAKVLIDAAQSVARIPIDVHEFGIDFMVFSGHKMYGPTGIGALYIKKGLETSVRPFITGGGAILEVTHTSVTYQPSPHGLEAGTPHIAGMIGMGAAAEYLMNKKVSHMRATETEVSRYAYAKLSEIHGLTLYSHKRTHGILSFTLDCAHPHDIAEILNRSGIAIRAGNHCVMPLHRYLGLPATARISLACYNTKQEIDSVATAIKKVLTVFS